MRIATLPSLATLILLSAVATSGGALADPSEVTNDQVQTGDVFSQQTLDVVTADQTVAVTTATGNSVLGSVESGSAFVLSNQRATGSITGHTVLNVSGSPGAATSITTAATGNTGDADVTHGGLGGTFNQAMTQGPGGTGLTARSQIEGADAEAGDIAQHTQAIANSQGFGLTNSASAVETNQSTGADTLADGGAIVGSVSGSSVISAGTVGNNVTSVGVLGSLQTVKASQDNTANLTQASQFTAYGNAQDSATQATAAANNVNLSNEGPSLRATTSQANQSYVRAQAEESSYEFGSAMTSAYGVGNSTLAGNSGSELTLDNGQLNTGGGIEAQAAFSSGGGGYDAYTSATAIGNAATGYACSACGGTISVKNRQDNYADVGASSYTSVSGAARNITATSTAVGNSGSFYVSQPHN
jgi:hypothetical protein